MKYQDALEDSLARLRRGEDRGSVMALYPQFADQLAVDLDVAVAAWRAPSNLPAPAAASRQRFAADLAAERTKRQAAPSRGAGGGLLSFRAPVFALGMAAAVALIAFVAFSGIIVPSNTAEASIEGVVVGNEAGVLTVQTEAGVRSIAVESGLSVSDESGANAELASLQPGQLLLIRGQSGSGETFVARRIEARTAAELQTWCINHAVACAALESQISQRVSECGSTETPACTTIRLRLQELRRQNEVLLRIKALQERCESGANVACREVAEYCRTNPGSCATIREWLRSRNLR